MLPINRVLKNKNQAVRQGARQCGKRSIFRHMWALARAAQRWMAASGAVFQQPVKGPRAHCTIAADAPASDFVHGYRFHASAGDADSV